MSLLIRILQGYKRMSLPRQHHPKIQVYKDSYKEKQKLARIEAEQIARQQALDYIKSHQAYIDRRHKRSLERLRSKVAKDSLTLTKQLQVWKQKDKIKQAKEVDFFQKEQLKKFNRLRILKVLEQQSKHWITSQNLKEIVANRVLPPEASSTEFYHKLQALGLAYQNLDLKEIQELMNQQSLFSYKNKKLIPLYQEFLYSLKKLKSLDPVKIQAFYQELLEAAPLQLKNKFQAERIQKLSKIQQGGTQLLREKLRLLLDMLICWSKYAEVLRMTNSEIRLLRSAEQKGLQLAEIKQSESDLYRKGAFVKKLSSLEQNFSQEEEQVDIKKLLKEEKQQKVQSAPNQEQESSQQQLRRVSEMLVNLLPAEHEVTVNVQELRQKEKINQNFLSAFYPKSVHKLYKLKNQNRALLTADQIPSHMREEWNVSVVAEICKSREGNDREIEQLLDGISEVRIDEGELLKKIWEAY